MCGSQRQLVTSVSNICPAVTQGLLRKSMAECVRLSEEVVRLEADGRGLKKEAAEGRDAAKAARREAEAAAGREAAARREADAASEGLERTREELEDERERHAEVWGGGGGEACRRM